MPRHRSVLAALACAASPALPGALAQPTFDGVQASMLTKSSSDVVTDGVITATEDSESTTSNGYTYQSAESEMFGPMGEEAYTLAEHTVYIGAYSIAGAFLAAGEAFAVVDSESIIGSRGVNEGEIRFTMSEDARVLLEYYNGIESSGSAFFAGGDGLGRIVVNGTRPDGTPFTLSRLNLPPSDGGFSEISGSPVLEIMGGTEVVLEYQMSAFAGASFPAEDHFAETILAFVLTVVNESGEPLDSDDDGLPDEWEEEGIDVDGDGTVDIDLPAMASDAVGGGGGMLNPGRKTLFVEVDSQNGVPVDEDAIAAVVRAFADAPVLNQDGTFGIDLIVIVDDDNLPNEEYDGNSWPPEFDEAKADFFGTAAMRALPNWESELKAEYAKVFRYCIWGQTIFKDTDDGSGGTFKDYFSGKGELPGNDFFVAAGEVASWYSSRPDLITDALAGTFMHEFGHNLNLRHGGHENKNYKPNYLSVMNYAYQIPSRNMSVEGTNLSDAWFLDFAQTDPSDLDETMLREDQGYDGPADRPMLFNTSPDGVGPALLFVDADATQIDWNFSGGPPETEPISVDLTRFRGEDDELDSALVARSDWDALWYHLSGADDFADGSHTSVADVEELSFNEFELLQTYVVHDLRTPDPCSVDLTGDGVLDLGDIQEFVTLFLASDLAADFNPDGVLDTGDITAFVAAYLEGC
ncbi:MAG: GC-type dockerin domain-anchored protein [Phycisphaerales bacterium JB040]